MFDVKLLIQMRYDASSHLEADGLIDLLLQFAMPRGIHLSAASRINRNAFITIKIDGHYDEENGLDGILSAFNVLRSNVSAVMAHLNVGDSLDSTIMLMMSPNSADASNDVDLNILTPLSFEDGDILVLDHYIFPLISRSDAINFSTMLFDNKRYFLWCADEGRAGEAPALESELQKFRNVDAGMWVADAMSIKLVCKDYDALLRIANEAYKDVPEDNNGVGGRSLLTAFLLEHWVMQNKKRVVLRNASALGLRYSAAPNTLTSYLLSGQLRCNEIVARTVRFL
jgi:hypothetical protein